MKHVEGKVAFITGGASGIGFGMAQVFLKAGMKVVIADILQERLDEAARILAQSTNRDYHFIRVDVTDRKAMAAAAAEAEQVFGKVHVLCNNAGVFGNLPIETASYEDWDWVLGVNLGGVVNGVVSFLPKMMAHGEGGHIVNTSSMAGLIPLPSAGGLYATSKFAVRGLTNSLRLALGAHNIGVSVLCPGMTRTRILQAELHRPGHEANEATDSEAHGSFTGDMTGGMDPVELGERVLLGIQRNDAYILPHGEFKDEVQGLFDDIISGFPEGQDIDPGRMEFEDRAPSGDRRGYRGDKEQMILMSTRAAACRRHRKPCRQMVRAIAPHKRGAASPNRTFSFSASAAIARSDLVLSASVSICGNDRWHDLPGHPVSVLQPAARTFLAAIGKPLPEVIDLVLGVARHLKRDRLVEFELWTAIEGDERLPVDLEFDGQDRSGLFAVRLTADFSVAAYSLEPGIFEYRYVEFRRLLSLCVEPQTRCDLMFDRRHGGRSVGSRTVDVRLPSRDRRRAGRTCRSRSPSCRRGRRRRSFFRSPCSCAATSER